MSKRPKRWLRLSAAVRATRGDHSLREAAQNSGLNFQTIHRAEHGQIRSIEAFRALCVWTQLDPRDALELTPFDQHAVARQAERQAIVMRLRDVLDELLR